MRLFPTLRHGSGVRVHARTMPAVAAIVAALCMVGGTVTPANAASNGGTHHHHERLSCFVPEGCPIRHSYFG